MDTRTLTVEGVPALRASRVLPTGVADFSNSEMFKSPASLAKPKAKRWDKYITAESKSRHPSKLKAAARYLKTPGLISLGGGLPSQEYFPYEDITIKAPSPDQFSAIDPENLGSVVSSTKHDVENGTSDFDLKVALNYGQSVGYAAFVRFVTEHVEIVHNPPYGDWEVYIAPGSTSGWDFALRMLCERGDAILTEEYTFCSAMEGAVSQGAHPIGVKMDSEGIIPASLDDIVANWDPTVRNARRPFVLYTVPSGQNPTGSTQSIERRREIYKVAQKHDLIIVEDDPYYFLQMQAYKGDGVALEPPPATTTEFIETLIPSYLSIDVDGRVLRLDSFSKVVSPGSRVSFAIGSDQLIERMVRHAEVSTQSPSGMSQLLLYKLLDQAWGHEGYLKWLIHIRMEYTKRRNTILEACHSHLPPSIASVDPPAAGMFIWIKVDWQKHPAAKEGKSQADVESTIFHGAIDEGVLISPGSWFVAEPSLGGTDTFFRATFAAAPADKINEALKRFGKVLRDQFKLE